MLTNLHFIGTLHAGLTPNQELESVIIEISPSLIMVEIAQQDIEEENISDYPPEMIFTYEFAKRNKIMVKGFDSKINVMREDTTKANAQQLLDSQKKIIGDKSWKDFNLSENAKLLDSVDNITDRDKWGKREKEMTKNIRKAILKNKTVLVITGCGHLDFFEHNYINASFPLK